MGFKHKICSHNCFGHFKKVKRFKWILCGTHALKTSKDRPCYIEVKTLYKKNRYIRRLKFFFTCLTTHDELKMWNLTPLAVNGPLKSLNDLDHENGAYIFLAWHFFFEIFFYKYLKTQDNHWNVIYLMKSIDD